MRHAEPPDEIARIAAQIEVHRVAELTQLDDLGLCVAAAIRRPFDQASISICAGRGLDWHTARRAAVAEALERYCAEPRDRFSFAADPPPDSTRIEITRLVPSTSGDELAWMRCTGVIERAPAWVPAAAVLFPYPAARAFAPATHGLAAGETIADATERALLECVERDAYTRAVALATQGLGHRFPPLAPEILGEPFRAIHDRVVRRGLGIVLRDLTGGTRIPTVMATIAEHADGQVWAHRGCAAAWNAAHAAERALGEAIQSRLVDIQGAREDLPAERASPDRWFFDATGEHPRAPAPSIEAIDRIGELARRLVADGCGEPVVVDLSLASCPWSVVRVVVPGLEVWADNPTRVGARLEAWCREP